MPHTGPGYSNNFNRTAVSPDGQFVYVLARPDDRVAKFSTADGAYLGNSGLINNANTNPVGIAVGPDGVVWFADVGNNPTQRAIGTLFETTNRRYPISEAAVDVGVDVTGAVFVAAADGHVRRYSPSGVLQVDRDLGLSNPAWLRAIDVRGYRVYALVAANDGATSAKIMAFQSSVPCSDGDACSGGDSCSAGTCQPHGDAPNGTTCDDTDPDTSDDHCYGGACVGCGDGARDDDETCDDGNVGGGDGCSATCDTEDGWSCPSAGGTCTLNATDLSAHASIDPTAIHVGETSTMTITVRNNGPAPVIGARLFLDRPMGPVSVPDTIAGCVVGAFEITCTHPGVLPTGASPANEATFEIPLTFDAVEQGWWLYPIDVTATHDGVDPDGGNDQASVNLRMLFCGDDRTDVADGEECEDKNATDGDGCSASCEVEDGWQCPIVGPGVTTCTCANGYQSNGSGGCVNAPDLAATLSVDPASIYGFDEVVTFTATARNDGITATTGVSLTLTFDPTLTPYDLASIGCDLVGGAIVCPIGALAAGAQQSFAVELKQSPTSTSDEATVEVTVDGDDVDPTSTNDSAEADVALERCGDGVVQTPEGCDDHDKDDGDGCSATCTVESPEWTCSGTAPSVCVCAALAGYIDDGDETCRQYDFGDAPASYGTLLPGGARHVLGGPRLGLEVDDDLDGQGGPDADGDGDDSLVAAPAFAQNAPASFNTAVTVTSGAAYTLKAWVDFNRDGDFGDAGEAFATVSGVGPASDVLVSGTVPANADPGPSYLRLRIATSLDGVGFGGRAADGEVEDWKIEIAGEPTVDVDATLSSTLTPVYEGGATNVIVAAQNNGSYATAGVKVDIDKPAGLTWGSLAGTGCTDETSTIRCDFGSIPGRAAATPKALPATVADGHAADIVVNVVAITQQYLDPDTTEGGSVTIDVLFCGDGDTNGDEACDDGAGNADVSAACRADCTLPACGDGVTDVFDPRMPLFDVVQLVPFEDGFIVVQTPNILSYYTLVGPVPTLVATKTVDGKDFGQLRWGAGPGYIATSSDADQEGWFVTYEGGELVFSAIGHSAFIQWCYPMMSPYGLEPGFLCNGQSNLRTFDFDPGAHTLSDFRDSFISQVTIGFMYTGPTSAIGLVMNGGVNTITDYVGDGAGGWTAGDAFATGTILEHNAAVGDIVFGDANTVLGWDDPAGELVEFHRDGGTWGDRTVVAEGARFFVTTPDVKRLLALEPTDIGGTQMTLRTRSSTAAAWGAPAKVDEVTLPVHLMSMTPRLAFMADGTPLASFNGRAYVLAHLPYGEECDDDNPTDGDGCTSCVVDPGYNCSGNPSECDVADADLEVSALSFGAAELYGTASTTLTATVRNNGPEAAADVTLTLQLPADADLFVNGPCDIDTALDRAICYVEAIPVGGTFDFVLGVQGGSAPTVVDPEIVTVTALSLTTPGNDPVPGNNAGDTATIELLFCGDGELDAPETCDDGNRVNGDGCVGQGTKFIPRCTPEADWTCEGAGPGSCLPNVDLDVTAIAFDKDTIYAGEATTLGVTVTNHGPKTATNVQLVLTMPDGDSVTVQTNDPACSEPLFGTMTCTFASLGDDASASISVVFVAPASPAVPVGLVIVQGLGSDGHDTDPGNDSGDSDSVTVTWCGDAKVNGTEGCDDGGVISSDGCSASCAVEGPAWTCTNVPANTPDSACSCNGASGYLNDGTAGTCLRYDFGDAGSPADGSDTYGTALPNGARHIVAGPRLGATVDFEISVTTSSVANGDDTGGGDDEDGVASLPTFVRPTATQAFDVSARADNGAGYTIKVWVDFNRDGDFADAGEAFGSANRTGNGSVQNVSISGAVPAGASLGLTAMRVRVGSDLSAVGPTGRALDGEVEDYQVSIVEGATDVDVTLGSTLSPVYAGGATNVTVAVINNGPRDTTGVTVDLSKPAGLTYGSLSGTGCTDQTTFIRCDFGSITSGASATTKTLPATIASDRKSDVTVSMVALTHGRPDVDASDSASTTIVVRYCGDQILTSPEACDDGDGDAGDGCGVTCAIETDWACSGVGPTSCSKRVDLETRTFAFTADSVYTGGSATLNVQVDNHSVHDVATATMQIAAPTAGTIVYLSASGAACSASSGAVTCTFAVNALSTTSFSVVYPVIASPTAATASVAVTSLVSGETDPTANEVKSDSIDLFWCGDGVVSETFSEGCDDGAKVGGDGCSAACAVEGPSWTCSNVPANTPDSTCSCNGASGYLNDGTAGTCLRYDFGDAGSPADGSDTYGTLLPGGARHIFAGPRLGATVDFETSVTTSAAANGDDTGGSDDEDGVATLPNFVRPTAAQAFDVSARADNGAGYTIKVWVDFNRDGDFGDAGEAFGSANRTGTGSAQTVSISGAVPAGASLGLTAMRVRVGSDLSAVGPTGRALDGEVEDYQVSIVEGATDVDVTLGSTLSPVYAGGATDVTVAVINNGPRDTTGVTVDLSKPAGLTWGSLSGTGCTDQTTFIRCDFGSISSGASATTKTLPATIAADRKSDVTVSMVALTHGRPDVDATDSAATTIVVRYCGDQILTSPEACDDGDGDAGDGCGATCAIETDWACNGVGPTSCSKRIDLETTTFAFSSETTYAGSSATMIVHVKNNSVHDVPTATLVLAAPTAGTIAFNSSSVGASCSAASGVVTCTFAVDAGDTNAFSVVYPVIASPTVHTATLAVTSLSSGETDPVANEVKSDTIDVFWCGDGIQHDAFSEGCDDGGKVAGDGCSETCAVEGPNWACTNVAANTPDSTCACNTAGGFINDGTAGTCLRYDLGDAGSPADGSDTYGTGMPGGARHVLTGPRLGATVDFETSATTSAAATGDDTTGSDDEDGVATLPTFARPSAAQAFDVSARADNGAAYTIEVWVDFNRDGDFGDAGEAFGSATRTGNGSAQTVSISGAVPAGASLGLTAMRVRVGSDLSAVGAGGRAADGEVEDYQVSIVEAVACGDGTVTAPETCDDGNDDDNDGCSAQCAPEAGWVCVGAGPASCTKRVDLETTAFGFVEAGVYAGGSATLNVSVRNNSVHAVGTATVVIGAPTAGTIAYDSATGATCSVATGIVTCTLPIGAGATASFSVTYKAIALPSAASASASLTSVSSGQTDPTANESGSDTIDVFRCGDGVKSTGFGETCDDGAKVVGDGCDAACHVEAGWSCPGVGPTGCAREADLETTVFAFAEDAIYAGASATLNVTVANNSVNPVTGATMVIGAPVAGGLAYTSASGASCSAAAGVVTCTFDVAASGTKAFSLTYGTATPLTLTDATLSVTSLTSSLADPNGANDTRSDSITLMRCGDAAVQESAAEACDDGNDAAGDGCDPTCKVETDWVCAAGVCTKRIDLGAAIAFTEATIYQDEVAHLNVTITNTSAHAVTAGKVRLSAPAAGALVRGAFTSPSGTCVQPSGAGSVGKIECGFTVAAGQSVTITGLYTAPAHPTVALGTVSVESLTSQATDPDLTDNGGSDSVTVRWCGDGTMDAGDGETCDDGNDVNGDACPDNTATALAGHPVCRVATCGDGYTQAGVEGCDDGNDVTTDECPSGAVLGAGAHALCQPATCGDGYVRATGNASQVETCDDGNASNTDGCPSGTAIAGHPTCRIAVCGDGYVRAGSEECDDGNGENGDACDDDPSPPTGTPGQCKPGETCGTLDTDGDGEPDCADDDDDEDGIDDAVEVGCGTDPLDGREEPADVDLDGSCDGIDDDDDNDDWNDQGELECGTDPLDGDSNPDDDGLDEDGDDLCDELDLDDDGDGWLDGDEVACGSDAHGVGSEPVDTDGDGTCDTVDADDDDDDVDDVDEVAIGSDPKVKDTDGDGLEDGVENSNGNGVVDPLETSPKTKDTDQDGIEDGVEVASGFPAGDGSRPTLGYRADTDSDGLGDGQEDANHNGRLDEGETNPLIADSDGDGAADGEEVACGTSPLDEKLTPIDLDGNEVCDALEEDSDGDGIINVVEIFCGTDPNDRDAFPSAEDVGDGDGDGTMSCLDSDDDDDLVIDVDELECGTDPRDATSIPGADDVRDYDGDGALNCSDDDDDNDDVTDAQEVVLGTGAQDRDSDDDGLSDGREVELGTSPTEVDSDGDGIQDGTESGEVAGTADTDRTIFVPDADPATKTAAMNADTDGDGVLDGNEDVDGNGRVDDAERDPNVPEVDTVDSDDDGLDDVAEEALGTDPEKPDTDDDGVGDKQEIDLGIDPLEPDTDRGGVFDGPELEAGTDPLDGADDFSNGAIGGGSGCPASTVGGTGAGVWMLAWLAALWLARIRRRRRAERG